MTQREAQVNVHDAKTRFSKLLARVQRGEQIVIAKAGRPVAKLVPIESAPPPRRLGTGSGIVHMSEDFDAPLPPEIAKRFYEGS